MRWPWPVAVASSVLTGALVLAGIVLAVVDPTSSTIAFAAVGTVGALCAGLGLVVARTVRHNPVGALLALMGCGVAFTATREIGERVVARHPDTLAHLGPPAALLEESSVWLLVTLALLLLYFPDGRVPGPRWRPVPPLLIVAGFIHHAYGAVDSVPFAPPLDHLARPWGPAPYAFQLVAAFAELGLFALVIAAAASLFVRFRRAGERERRQVKWLALAGLGVPGFIVVCLSELLVFGQPEWGSAALGIATLVGIPVATAIAMLRYELYDVDRALATTVSYGVITAVLLTIFAVASFAGGLLLGRGSTAAAAAATALSALALSPLRAGLQRRVDRRLYPLREAALSAIADLQRAIHDGEGRPEQLADRLRGALREPDLRVGYVIPGGSGLVDESGVPLDAAGAVPVVMGGVTIGALRAPALSVELLDEVANASATLVEVVRLRLELTAALRDVEASRARLVQVGYEERRRLERDLHDGAQQRLVSLGMALRVAQRHLDARDDEVYGLLDQAVAELATAVAELRQVAHGLRPSSLDDGLHAALAALTQHVPIPVGLDVREESLPDDVATTVYYVASEAIANAVKHAGASRIDVCIARRRGQLAVRITDDGRGGATVTAGSGLAGLTDRVSALGGALELASEHGCGTTIEAAVPCAW